MNRIAVVMLVSIAVMAGMLFLLPSQPMATTMPGPSDAENDRTAEPAIADTLPIELYCAASNRVVMERIRQAYEQETGQTIQVQYGASQSLLASIEVAGKAELYIPADDSYLQLAQSKSLIAESYPLAKMHLILAVRKGNPKQIHALKDLVREDVRLVQANPDAAAVGKLTRDALRRTGDWDAIDNATKAYGTAVSDVANDLKLGSADAGFIYDVMLNTYSELEAVMIPQIADSTAMVAVGIVTKKSPTRPAVEKFVRYLQAKDRGLKLYAEEGFEVVAGDHWVADH